MLSQLGQPDTLLQAFYSPCDVHEPDALLNIKTNEGFPIGRFVLMYQHMGGVTIYRCDTASGLLEQVSNSDFGQSGLKLAFIRVIKSFRFGLFRSTQNRRPAKIADGSVEALGSGFACSAASSYIRSSGLILDGNGGNSSIGSIISNEDEAGEGCERGEPVLGTGDG